MTSILFLSTRNFRGSDITTKPLRGTQTTTIQLAEHLAVRGHKVECVTETDAPEKYKGVIWSTSPQQLHYDLAVANLRPELLDGVSASKKCLWVHNPLHRFSRIRRNFIKILQHRPEGIFLSNQQFNATPWFLPFKSRHLIEHGIDESFLDNQVLRSSAPAPVAMFASHPHRNLDPVIDVWKKQIHPNLKEAELHIYSPDLERHNIEELKTHNIIYKGMVPRAEIINAYKTARILLYPGHIEETFCSVAHEASACGLPIVTRGIGSMIDRIVEGKNGHIAASNEEMGNIALRLLQDDSRWKELHSSTISEIKFHTWADRAEVWEKTFLS